MIPEISFQTSLVSISQMNQEQMDKFNKFSCWYDSRPLFAKEDSSNSYQQELYFEGNLFKKKVEKLTNEEIYLDVGAGKGVAITEYRETYPEKAKVIGIAVNRVSQEKDEEKIVSRDREDLKFSYYLADFTEFPTASLCSSISLITDIYASFHYSCRKAEVIRKMGELLKPGGMAFIVYKNACILVDDLIQRKVVVLDTAPSSKEKGSKLLLLMWFHTIKGFNVVYEGMTKLEDIKNDPSILTIRRMSDSIVLERNDEEVVVDEISAEVVYNANCGEPYYTWKTSPSSEEWLKKIKYLGW